MKSRTIKVFAGMALVGTAACAGPQEHELATTVPEAQRMAFLADKPEPTKRLYERVVLEGERNVVLNHLRAGVAAMEIGSLDQAGASFDEAIVRIETIYADNPAAAQARSKFTKENIKDFKGEPYERAMAFYYSGLVYLMEGDFENARARFRGGQLQDSFAEDQTYAADFASLAWLEGWASQCLDQPRAAAEKYAEATSGRPGLPPPPADADMLLVAESGTGPTKAGEGEHREKLVFNEGSSDGGATFVLGDHQVTVSMAEDIYYQAMTRGGREIDGILEGKAAFKDTAQTAGEIGLAGGYGLTQAANQNMQAASMYGAQPSQFDAIMGLVGVGVSAAGLISNIVAEATTPEADIRYWDNLPSQLHLGATRRPDGLGETAVARFASLSGDREVTIVNPGRCSIAWGRSRSALEVPDSAPGAVASR